MGLGFFSDICKPLPRKEQSVEWKLFDSEHLRMQITAHCRKSACENFNPFNEPS